MRTCPSCKKEHPAGTTCGGLTTDQSVPAHKERDVRDMAWTIVKSKEVRAEHPHAFQWARDWLGLTDRTGTREEPDDFDPEA